MIYLRITLRPIDLPIVEQNFLFRFIFMSYISQHFVINIFSDNLCIENNKYYIIINNNIILQ